MFLSICDIQPMNVIIEGNLVTSSDYAEGNEYALSNFFLVVTNYLSKEYRNLR